MSAERGWIGDPQPSVGWRDPHYSRQADRIAAARREKMRNKTETVMDQKDRAMRGWLGEPQPQRDHKPSHALKWYKMMGAAELLPHNQRVAEHQAAETKRASSHD